MNGVNYYLLAIVVFVLGVALIVLYDRLKRSRNAEKDESVKEKEQRLFRLYQNLEDMMNGMEEYIEEAKNEIKDETESAERRIRRMGAGSVSLDEARLPEAYSVRPPIMELRGATKTGPYANGPAQAAADEKKNGAVKKPKAKAKDSAPKNEAGPHARQGEQKSAVPAAPAAGLKPARKTAAKENAKSAAEAGATAPARPPADEKPKLEALPAKKEGTAAPAGVKRGKVEDVRRLHQSGLSEDKIARALSLSQGEVNLILGMLSHS